MGLQAAALARQHPSEKILCDEIRAARGEATLICLGPLTNLALALRLEPELPALLRQVIIMGGSISGTGNITPCAEFNIYCDPASARAVFRSSLPLALVPLETSSQLTWSMDLIEKLPAEDTRAGKLLRQMLPFLFRSYHQHLGREGIHLHDTVAIALAAHPELFTLEAMAGDVELKGELTTGMTVFDRRPRRRARGSLEVATEADIPAVVDYTLRGLTAAGEATR
jgi:purine nucleosidase